MQEYVHFVQTEIKFFPSMKFTHNERRYFYTYARYDTFRLHSKVTGHAVIAESLSRMGYVVVCRRSLTIGDSDTHSSESFLPVDVFRSVQTRPRLYSTDERVVDCL